MQLAKNSLLKNKIILFLKIFLQTHPGQKRFQIRACSLFGIAAPTTMMNNFDPLKIGNNFQMRRSKGKNLMEVPKLQHNIIMQFNLRRKQKCVAIFYLSFGQANYNYWLFGSAPTKFDVTKMNQGAKNLNEMKQYDEQQQEVIEFSAKRRTCVYPIPRVKYVSSGRTLGCFAPISST